MEQKFGESLRDTIAETEMLNRVAKEVTMERAKAMAQEIKQADQKKTMGKGFDPTSAPYDEAEKQTGPAMDCGQFDWQDSGLIGAKINKSSSAANLFKDIDARISHVFRTKLFESEKYDKLLRLQRLAGNNPEIVELIELMKELGY